MIIYNENNTNNIYTHEITIRENSQYTRYIVQRNNIYTHEITMRENSQYVRYIVQRTLITSTLNGVAPLVNTDHTFYTRVYRAS